VNNQHVHIYYLWSSTKIVLFYQETCAGIFFFHEYMEYKIRNKL